MALSFFSDSAAPKDFRISSTESESPYTKCLLCYTFKKNFYCTDCIKAGNFVNSTMPYADRFAEKQLKLHRLKSNRKYVQDRCEIILKTKRRKEDIEISSKQCREQIKMIKLAIEESRTQIQEKRLEVIKLKDFNTELKGKLPKYEKRVAALGKLAVQQRTDMESKCSAYNEEADNLATLRRARIRQLIRYIFPVYVTYDTSDSTDELEFLRVDSKDDDVGHSRDEGNRTRVHVVAPWLPADCDFSNLQNSGQHRRSESTENEIDLPHRRIHAALCFAAQLTTLLAWFLDWRLPVPLSLTEWGESRASGAALRGRVRRLCAALWACSARAGVPPPGLTLLALDRIAAAVNTDDPAVGRVEGWVMWDVCGDAEGDLMRDTDSDDDEPEHLHWSDAEQVEELGSSPPLAPPAASLVTSAAATLASMWRGWTK